MKKTLKQWQPPKKRDHCFAPTDEAQPRQQR
jgi:hypothetical protein